MATFAERVEALVGTGLDSELLNGWLTAAGHMVVHLLPIDELPRYSQAATVTTNGYSMTGCRFVGASKSGYPATQRPWVLYAQLADANSIHYASTTSPAYYVRDGKLYIVPSGGEASVVPFPAISSLDEAVSGWTDDLEEIVVLRAAVEAKVSIIRSRMNTLVQSLGAAPTASTITLTTEFNTAVSLLETSDDVEAAAGKLNEIQVRLQEFTAEGNLAISQYAARLGQAVQEQQTLLLELKSLQELLAAAISMRFGATKE